MDNIYLDNLYIIALVGKNLEIGKDNKLLIHIPEDLKRFKEITLNNYIIMGKNTYLSLPKKLEDRKYIILSSSMEEKDDLKVFRNVDDTLDYIYKMNSEAYVIGGGMIYKEFLPYASKLYLTEVDRSFDADTYFPNFNKDEWCLREGEINIYKEYIYRFNEYRRMDKVRKG